jgi:S1-C subfamily serine protease
VSIQGTISGTPAAKSALAPDDIITSLDGQSISTATALDEILQKLHPGDSVRVGYTSQSGVHATLNLQLASGPPQ